MNRTLTWSQLRAVLAAAIDVAADPPEQHSKYGTHFYVRRSHVEALRATLEAAGLDWRALCRLRHQRRGPVITSTTPRHEL